MSKNSSKRPSIDTQHDKEILGAYNAFIRAETFPLALDHFSTLCTAIPLDYTSSPRDFYQALRTAVFPAAHLARPLFKILDARSFQKEYQQQLTKSRHLQVLIVGAGPAGLRCAIECALLGCNRVTVLEKRHVIRRNNVLHLWPFVISDLKQIGGKEIYRKIGVGEFEHISIWRLQTILLKLALLLGVRVHLGVEYTLTRAPTDAYPTFHRAHTTPELDDKILYNVLVAADGEKSLVQREHAFTTKVFYSGMALGITANFVQDSTQDTTKLRQGGFISYANKSFFSSLQKNHGIVLENIVYYCAEQNHYFVMAVKLASLVERGVLIHGKDTVERLLQKGNVDPNKLKDFVRTVVHEYGLPKGSAFVRDAKGNEDCVLFDFTNKKACERPSKMVTAPIKLVDDEEAEFMRKKNGEEELEEFPMTPSVVVHTDESIGLPMPVHVTREMRRPSVFFMSDQESVVTDLPLQSSPVAENGLLSPTAIIDRPRFFTMPTRLNAPNARHSIANIAFDKKEPAEKSPMAADDEDDVEWEEDNVNDLSSLSSSDADEPKESVEEGEEKNVEEMVLVAPVAIQIVPQVLQEADPVPVAPEIKPESVPVAEPIPVTPEIKAEPTKVPEPTPEAESSTGKRQWKPPPIQITKRVSIAPGRLKSPFLDGTIKGGLGTQAGPLKPSNNLSPITTNGGSFSHIRRHSWNPMNVSPVIQSAGPQPFRRAFPRKPVEEQSSEEDEADETVPHAKLLVCVIGDALLEPFWPMGTGAANASLSAQDAAWSIRRFADALHTDNPDAVELARRKQVLNKMLKDHRLAFRLLQTSTADSIRKTDLYSIDPASRYTKF